MTAKIYDFISERVKRVKPAVKYHNPALIQPKHISEFLKDLELLKAESLEFKEYGEHFK